MSDGPATKLYTPELLALAIDLSNYPFDQDHPLTGQARSRSCGSSLEISLSLDTNDSINALGMRVTACAIGQAAAAIFAKSAIGKTPDSIAASLAPIESWLGAGGNMPDWPGFAALGPARDYPGRHGAILLPWRAIAAALCKSARAG
jgi:NifU-like protein involved in Fe-S cluster formation